MSYFGVNLTQSSSLIQWAEALAWSGPKSNPYVKWASILGYTLDLRFCYITCAAVVVIGYWPSNPRR